MGPSLKRGLQRIVAVLWAMVCAGSGVAAEPRPTMHAVQAMCIQEAMLLGVIGEKLKGYVESCVKAKGSVPVQDVTPESTDTPAC